MSASGTQGTLVPFRVDAMPMQRHFIDTVLGARKTRAVELKARRVGGTTLFQMLGMVKAMRTPNFTCGLIAQNEQESIRFCRMWKQIYTDMVPKAEMPDGSLFLARPSVGVFSDHMIEFPSMGSYLAVGTAGSNKLWRGGNFNWIIGTEVSRWDVGRPPGTAEETWAMAEGALVPGGFGVLESTAFGAGGFFYTVYTGAKNGDNGWTPVFYSWKWHPIYRLYPDSPDTLDADRGPLLLTEAETTLGLDEPQARWRRFKVASMPGPTAEAKLALFLQEYPEDDITCFTVSGNPFFDVARVDEAVHQVRPITKSGESGALLMWQTPRVGESYVVGVDPGGDAPARSQGHDFAAAIVVDSRGQHVASLHGQWDSRTFAELVARTGHYYNDAHLVVESGPYGDAVLLVLATYLRYTNLYVEKDSTGKPRKMGKSTSWVSKPAMADTFKELFETGTFRTDDHALLAEMRNFHRVQLSSGRIGLEAIAGHDDRVMAAILAMWAWSEGGWRKSGKRTKIHIPGRQ